MKPAIKIVKNKNGIEIQIKFSRKEKNKGNQNQSCTGRPDKESVVRDYIATHPDETNIARIARECGCSRPTVYKYLEDRRSERNVS